jgi:3-polyprenyl-4-hydroxybenzoate decarboxylase
VARGSSPLLLLIDAEITGEVITGVRTMAEWSLPVVVLTIKKPPEGLDMRSLVNSLKAPLTNPGTVTVAVDHGADAKDTSMIMWLVTGNSDPSRDFYRLKGGAIFIDATSKPGSLPAFPREWPNVVCSDNNTIDLVDRRWKDYNIGEFRKSPSLRVLPLLRSGLASVEPENTVRG